jgi:hypothetical protein
MAMPQVSTVKCFANPSTASLLEAENSVAVMADKRCRRPP